jgi:hypothetical protein
MTGDNLAARDPSFSHTEMLSAHKLLDFGMNGLNVAGALFFVAGTLILLRTVTAEGVWQVSDENIAGGDAVSMNSRGLSAPPVALPVRRRIDKYRAPTVRTYFLPKFYTARLELLDSPFEIFNIVFDQVAQPPL